VQLGREVFEAMGHRFYFNRAIAVFDTGERELQITPGELPTPTGQDPYALAQMAIGQGELLVTPTHLVMIVATIANRGVMMKPRLNFSDSPQALVRSVPQEIAAEVARMMRDVVVSGTGRGINMPDLTVAGKTGTAENSKGASHSWFIGFAPYENPQVAFSVLVEHGGYGSQTAVPIARRLLIRTKELGFLEPHRAQTAGAR
jgi:peptidoglycan glycosyltransferase